MTSDLGHFIQLLLLSNAGLFLACRMVRYDIPNQRKVIAASAFALLYSLPLPIGALIHILPPVALWMLLKDEEADARNRLPVLLLTYGFAALGTLALFYLIQGRA